MAADAKNDDAIPAIALMGPTAAGKTGAAMLLARRLPLDVVSVDSALVYRGLDIGTAKPTAEELARVPHRLIDICDPTENYSAGRFRRDALVEIDAIRQAGRVPLLVGGTMLYFRALLDGIDVLPAAHPAVRAQLDAQAAEIGWPALHARLAQLDPDAAARIHPNDRQRIQRALEVHMASGQTLSAWQARPGGNTTAFDVLRIALLPGSRAQLHERIASRFAAMLDAGFVAEVRALHARGDLTTGHSAVRAVGYRQLWAWLDGEIDYPQAVADAVTATRRLARRQLTWLRREPAAVVIDPDRPDAAENVLERVSNWLADRADRVCYDASVPPKERD